MYATGGRQGSPGAGASPTGQNPAAIAAAEKALPAQIVVLRAAAHAAVADLGAGDRATGVLFAHDPVAVTAPTGDHARLDRAQREPPRPPAPAVRAPAPGPPTVGVAGGVQSWRGSRIAAWFWDCRGDAEWWAWVPALTTHPSGKSARRGGHPALRAGFDYRRDALDANSGGNAEGNSTTACTLTGRARAHAVLQDLGARASERRTASWRAGRSFRI